MIEKKKEVIFYLCQFSFPNGMEFFDGGKSFTDYWKMMPKLFFFSFFFSNFKVVCHLTVMVWEKYFVSYLSCQTPTIISITLPQFQNRSALMPKQ